jgi:hypothetical protein
MRDMGLVEALGADESFFEPQEVQELDSDSHERRDSERDRSEVRS